MTGWAVHRLWLVGGLVVAVAGGCARGADPGRERGFKPVHDGVCAALEAARAGDRAGAQREFGGAHGRLHDLAASAGNTDRAAAARLLEAKQRAEATLRERPSMPPTPALETLSDAVRRAIEATGEEPPRSCSP